MCVWCQLPATTRLALINLTTKHSTIKCEWAYSFLPFYLKNKLRWYPQQPPRLYFYKSFWSMLRSQTPKLGFCELNSHKSCWTWPDSAPEPPKPSPEPSPEPCWTWPGSAPKPPGLPEPSPTWLCRTFSGTLLNPTGLRTKASHTFSETFSETLLNLTWLHQSLPDLLWNFLRNLLFGTCCT